MKYSTKLSSEKEEKKEDKWFLRLVAWYERNYQGKVKLEEVRFVWINTTPKYTLFYINSFAFYLSIFLSFFEYKQTHKHIHSVPADHKIKLKECEKKGIKKKLWNMKVTIIPIVIGAFGTVTKGLLKGLEDLEVGGWVETIQTTALLRTARILRRVLETWGDLLSLELYWNTIS